MYLIHLNLKYLIHYLINKMPDTTLQQGKLLGALSYDTAPKQFVAPPIAERKALMKTKEDDYILTANTKNAIEDAKRNLPKDLSPEIYNNLLRKTDEVLNGVNADNYSDKVLDVQQFSHDFVNKLGGKELIEQKQQLGEASKVYDDALAKGDIVDPQMADWYKQRVRANVTPLGFDENGFVTKPNVKPVPYAKYQDMQALLDERIKGWAEDGTISVDKNTGNILVNKQIPGYFGITQGTHISKEELLKAGQDYLRNDAKVQSYLNDKVAFDTRNVIPDANTLDTILTPEMKQVVLGNPNADVSDIQQAINDKSINPNSIIKTIFKEKTIADNSRFTAEKYGFDKETITLHEDKLLLESLKAQQDANKAAKLEQSNVSVTVQPFTTQQVVNPTDIGALQINKLDLITKRKNAQIEINAYKKELANGNKDYSQETLDLKNEELSRVDQDIEELNNQQASLSKVMFDNAKKAGVDLNKTYTSIYNETKERVVTKSKEALKDIPYSVDVTNLVKYENGKAYIDNPNVLGHKQYIVNGDAKGFAETDAIIKEGDKYVYKNLSSQGRNISDLIPTDTLLKPDGTLRANVTLTNKDDIRKLYKVPTIDEFKQMSVDAYNKDASKGKYNPFSDTDAYGDYTYDTGQGYKLLAKGKFIDDIDKVRESQGDFEWTIATPLSHLAVFGATQKTNLIAYNNMEKATNATFKETPEQFSIATPSGPVDFGKYMKDTYGIPSIDSTYIDWSKTNAKILLQTDRKYGQKTGLNIVLTKEGKEALGDKAKEVYGNFNSIKLVGLNLGQNIPEQQNLIKDTLLKTYADLSTDNSAHATDNKKQMGILYLNNSQEGTELNKMNLYTMAAGETKNWNVKGTDYQISTTTRDATQSDLMNVDFHLNKIQDNQQMTMATDGKETTWKPLKFVQDDKSWKQVYFNSPEDIKAVVGATLLDAEFNARRTNAANIPNAYQEYMNNSGYYQKSSKQTIVKDYGKVVKTVETYYGKTTEPVTILNNSTGKKTAINFRVPLDALESLTDKYSNRIADTVEYPYINKTATHYVDNIMNDFPVTITGGVRGETSVKGSAENSLHKYGLALDLRADKNGLAFLNTIKGNSDLLKKYGIVNLLEHGEDNHIHVEFAPNTI